MINILTDRTQECQIYYEVIIKTILSRIDTINEFLNNTTIDKKQFNRLKTTLNQFKKTDSMLSKKSSKQKKTEEFIAVAQRILFFLNEVMIKRIITEDVAGLRKINEEFVETFGTLSNCKSVKLLLGYLFDYECLKRNTEYNNKRFLDHLNLRVCPYCNRAYIFKAVNKGRSFTPQLDHYYPKAIYPIFSLSFYNLIPSCETCNSLKNDSDTIQEPIFYPFSGETTVTFKLVNWKMENEKLIYTKDTNYVIEYSDATIGEKTKNVLGLNSCYLNHKYEVEELLELSRKYTPSVLSSISTFLKSNNIQFDYNALEADIFKCSESSEIGKIPLDKLRTDVYQCIKSAYR